MADFTEILSYFKDSLGQFADRSAKWLLANPENLRGLFEIIGEALVASLDFSQVQHVNTTFIADNLREQESDMVFLLPFRDAEATEVLLYILIEHQSTVDPVMGFRMLSYMYHIWDQQGQGWVAERVPKRQWRFRPVIPVVFYTGSSAWHPVISMEVLLDVREPLLRFVPRFETLFLGLQCESDGSLLRAGGAFGWLLPVLKRADVVDSGVFVSVLETLGAHVSGLRVSERASWVQAVCYLYALVVHKRSVAERADLDRIVSECREALNLSEEAVNVMQSMAEHYLEQGIAKGIKQGVAKGIKQGREEGRVEGREEGARQMSIESTLATLNARFPQADVTALEPRLQAIQDLNHLKHLNLTAAVVETFTAFREHLAEARTDIEHSTDLKSNSSG